MEAHNLIKVLKAANATLLNEETFGELDGEANLVRNIDFNIAHKHFNILWFKKLMRLSSQCGMSIMFDNVEYSGTWPNNFKKNLQFYRNGDTIAVIGIERY